MATFYCRHSLNASHSPFPGTRVEAADKPAAALAYAVLKALPPNTVIAVNEEPEWYVSGQVSPATAPTYV